MADPDIRRSDGICPFASGGGPRNAGALNGLFLQIVSDKVFPRVSENNLSLRCAWVCRDAEIVPCTHFPGHLFKCQARIAVRRKDLGGLADGAKRAHKPSHGDRHDYQEHADRDDKLKHRKSSAGIHVVHYIKYGNTPLSYGLLFAFPHPESTRATNLRGVLSRLSQATPLRMPPPLSGAMRPTHGPAWLQRPLWRSRSQAPIAKNSSWAE